MERSPEEGSTAVEALRTVTPPYAGRPNAEMDVLGWGLFLGLVVLVLPFLPSLIVLWVATKLLNRLAGRRS